jgi:hypothetical protein
MSDISAMAFGARAPANDRGATIPPLDPLSFAFWCVLGAAAVATAVAAHFTGMRFSGVLPVAVYFAALITIGLVLRQRGYFGIGAFVEGVAQLKLTLFIFGFLAMALAGTNLPYRDAELMAIDRMLFPIDWLAASQWMTANAGVALVLSLSYTAIVWQGPILLFALAVTGKLRRMRLFILAWAICLFFVLAIFPLVPAVGFYLHNGVAPEAMPGVYDKIAWLHLNSLQPVRDGILRDIHVTRYSGVVTFPSFHAAAAILFAWGFYGVKSLRVPAFMVNGAMFISSMPVGGHYIIDIAVGSLLCVIALAAAQKLSTLLRGPADEDGEGRLWWPRLAFLKSPPHPAGLRPSTLPIKGREGSAFAAWSQKSPNPTSR